MNTELMCPFVTNLTSSRLLSVLSANPRGQNKRKEAIQPNRGRGSDGRQAAFRHIFMSYCLFPQVTKPRAGWDGLGW